MRTLFIRTIREIRNNLGQFLSLVLVIAVGSFMFTGLFSTIDSLKSGINEYYREQNMADIWTKVKGVTDDQINELNKNIELENSIFEGRISYNAEGIYHNNDINIKLYSLTKINELELKEGKLPANKNEIVVDSKFAELNDLEIGSQLVVNGKQSNYMMRVVGIADSPENVWKVNDSTLAVTKNKTFTIAYTTLDTLKDLVNSSLYTEILIRTDNSTQVIHELEQLDSYVTGILREEQVSVKAVEGSVDTIGVISYIFPVIFFLVASLIAFISMCKMIDNQRIQIAVMQALGISKMKILIGYISYPFIASLIGSFFFSLMGNYFIPNLLIEMFTTRYILPALTIRYQPVLILLPFLLGLILCGIATFLALHRVLKEVPAQAMRPKPPKKSRVIMLEKLRFIWSKLNYSSKLICRNVFLNKSRIVLSSIGVIGSVALMITGLSLQNSANTLIHQGKNQIGYDVSLVFNQPIDEAEFFYQLNSLDIKDSTFQAMFTQTIRTSLPEFNHKNMNMQILQKDNKGLNLVNMNKEELVVSDSGIVIASCMADELGIRIGDIITIAYQEHNYTVTVQNIVFQYTGSTAYLSEDYAKEMGINLAYDTALIVCKDRNQVANMVEFFELDQTVKSVITKEEIISSTGESMAMLNTIIRLIIIAAATLSITVVYNITSINIFERRRELATLRVLGYYKTETEKLIFAENFIISILGFLLGIPSGVLLFRTILNAFQDAGIYLPQMIGMKNIAYVFVMVMLLTLITNLLIKGRISRIDMVESLKSIE